MKVCLFDLPVKRLELHEYQIESFNPLEYLTSKSHFDVRDLIAGGLDGFKKRRAITRSDGVDRLYRNRDPAYMKMMQDFVNRFSSYDLIVMSTYNFIHPEILVHELTRPIKILGFVDDPHSTYLRGIPYLWAFDGAFFISPSYDDQATFGDALAHWGCPNTHWWPLTQPTTLPERSEEFFRNRSMELIYVGNPTLTKIDRLIDLKRHFKGRFRVHGRWRARGYYGMLRGLIGMPMYWGRVTPLKDEEQKAMYSDTRIGFNMHVSERPTETGNMRMYETPAHGMMQVCDKAARNAHEQIYLPGKEAVFYDDISDAVEKIEYYLAHEMERVEIAQAGYERVRRDYKWESCLLKFLGWAGSLPKRQLLRR